MPRNMSFMLTTEQIRNRTKTVTRRVGWDFLTKGDIVNACVKCMGLKKGEKIEKICQIRITDVRWELLKDITQEECIKEGFPEKTPQEFIDMFMIYMGTHPSKMINRIEFEYIDGEAGYNKKMVRSANPPRQVGLFN